MNQNSIYFENSFGKIYGDSICLGKKNRVLAINDIAFLRIRSKADKSYNIIAFLIALLFLVGMLFYQNNFTIFSLFMGGSILNFFIALIVKKEDFFVQVILCKVDQIIIKIDKNQRHEVDELVRKLAVYRYQNF